MNATTFREFVYRHNADLRNQPIQRLRFRREVEAYYPVTWSKGRQVDTRC